MGRLTARFRDYSDEYSTLSVLVPDLDTADVWNVIVGLGAGIANALEDLSLATLVSVTYHEIANPPADDTRPTSPFAQREQGLRFFYSDNVDASKYNITVPAPDLAIVADPGSDDVDLTITEVAALVTWLESNVLSPNGNAITVDRAVIVGRNS